MRIILTACIFFLININIAFAKYESGTNDAVSTVIYGKNGNTLVPLSVDSTGAATISGGIGTSSPDSMLTVKERNYFDFVYNFNGVSTYTNNTTESKSTFGTAWSTLADNTQYMYLGKTTTFQNIIFSFKVNTTSNPTLNAQYWNGSTWSTLSITDNTSGFQSNGTVTFTVPSDWAQTAVNSQTYYWVRLYFTSSPSTTPSVLNVRPATTQTVSVYSSNGDVTPTWQVTNSGNILSNGNSVATPVTIVVASSTSRSARRADFTCSGTKDQVCLNAALAACGSNPCNIVLLEGTFNITGPIGYNAGLSSLTPLINNLTISGQGWGLTKIVSSNYTGATIQDIVNFSTGSPLTNFTLHDLEIDRSADTKDANTSRKALFVTYMKNAKIYNVYAHDSGGTCLGIDYLNGAIITNNRLDGCGTSTATTGSSGVGVGTGEYTTEPVVIANNIITNSGYGGVLLEAQGGATAGTSNNYIVANNIITAGPQYGIVVRGTSNVLISGNLIRSNTKDGILIDDYASQLVANVTINGNIVTSNTLYGINIADAGATKLSISNNDFNSNGSGTITNNLTDISQLRRVNNLADSIAAQTIAATNTITADACGTYKDITSAGAVTTNTTNTFTAPSAANAGCAMDVCNIGSNNITLDNNANFKSAAGGDVVMTADDCVRVRSNGTTWYQVTALEAN